MIQNRKNYVGSLTSGALLGVETRLLLPYLRLDLLEKEWEILFEKENLLQKKTVNTSMRYMRTIKKRFAVLGDHRNEFIEDLINSDREEFNQLILLLIILNSPIVADFMLNIIKQHTRFIDEALSDNAWSEFIEDRLSFVPDLAEYSESTLKKIGATVINILTEVGYFNNTKEKKLQTVYITDLLKKWLRILNKEGLREVFECTM